MIAALKYHSWLVLPLGFAFTYTPCRIYIAIILRLPTHSFASPSLYTVVQPIPPC